MGGELYIVSWKLVFKYYVSTGVEGGGIMALERRKVNLLMMN